MDLPTCFGVSAATIFLVLTPFAAATLPPTNPPWPPTYDMGMSTLTMQCNGSGWSSPERGAQFGVVSYDWSNNKARWAPLTPSPRPSFCAYTLIDLMQRIFSTNSSRSTFAQVGRRQADGLRSASAAASTYDKDRKPGIARVCVRVPTTHVAVMASSSCLVEFLPVCFVCRHSGLRYIYLRGCGSEIVDCLHEHNQLVYGNMWDVHREGCGREWHKEVF